MSPVKALRLLLLFLATPMHAAMLPVQTVFVIVMENHNWADIKDSASAPYLNGTLLPMASYCERYYNPPAVHPSLPNYLWLEAGTNFGIEDDEWPAVDHQSTTEHLVTLLEHAGISWRAYQEDIQAGYVPLQDTNLYAVRHDPFVYFDDVTGTNNPASGYGIAHVRPYSELAFDLTNHSVAPYNVITPNVVHDGHDAIPPAYDAVAQTDGWLASELPRILGSSAFSNRGAVFITWDEGENGSDGPIGMIVLSPLGRGQGYFNRIHYTHSSTLRTLQEVFGVGPLLGDAANAIDVGDLFCRYAIDEVMTTDGIVRLHATGVIPGRTNIVQASADLVHWLNTSTNVVTTNSFVVDETFTLPARFYRLTQLP